MSYTTGDLISMGYMDYEPSPEPRCLENSAHKARKPHCCDVCQNRIEVGERYSRTVYLNPDGEFFDTSDVFVVFKAHEDTVTCRKMANEREAAVEAWEKKDMEGQQRLLEEEARKWGSKG